MNSLNIILQSPLPTPSRCDYYQLIIFSNDIYNSRLLMAAAGSTGDISKQDPSLLLQLAVSNYTTE